MVADSESRVPGPAGVVDRVSALAPTIREHAAWSEQNRRLPQAVVDALAEAGVFKLRVPTRFGGYESDTRTLVDVATELARADGSAAWTASVFWIPTWMVGMFPEEVQQEIFGTPDVRVCGTLSPGGTATPVDGGFVVNGKWGFITGAHHSQWQEIIAIRTLPDGTPMPVVGMVPMSDLQIVDDWHTSALQGTGSVSTVAVDLFVPEARVVPIPVVLEGLGGARGRPVPAIHRVPLLPVASASSVGTVLGLAQAAREVFIERLADRTLTYTDYPSQREAPVTHLQLAEATMKIDEARFHAHRLTSTVDAKAAGDLSWTVVERVTARADMGAACRLAKEAVDLLAAASGGTSIYTHVRMQQIARDVRAVNLHALMNPTTNYELYGRVLCGLEPNTQYI